LVWPPPTQVIVELESMSIPWGTWRPSYSTSLPLITELGPTPRVTAGPKRGLHDLESECIVPIVDSSKQVESPPMEEASAAPLWSEGTQQGSVSKWKFRMSNPVGPLEVTSFLSSSGWKNEALRKKPTLSGPHRSW
jgi:hypothetical protein